MKIMRIPLLVLALALAGAVLPATATAELPEACAGRGGAIELAAGETLVETTGYFTSPGRIGNLDANDSEWSVTTSEDEPEGDESKVMVSRPGSLGNAAVQRNFVNGFFTHELDAPTRVVCARLDLHVTSANSSLPIQFFLDGTEFSAIATGSPGHGSAYSAPVRRLDGMAWDITVQFNAGAPGAAILYDSADHPSSLTLVTVEKD